VQLTVLLAVLGANKYVYYICTASVWTLRAVSQRSLCLSYGTAALAATLPAAVAISIAAV
jgi:hypothetical protein